MADQLSQLSAELDDIRRMVAALERRLSALEHPLDTQATGDHTETTPDGETAPAPEALPRASGALFALAGRAFLGFCGAFVLRALTESAVVGASTGAWLGVGYAAAWLLAADRATGAGRVLNGWLGLTIALPLVLEAGGRLNLLSVGASVVALALVSGLALTIAWHRKIASLAAGASAGSALVAIALGIATGALLPLAALQVPLGIATLWIAYHREWRWLAWLSAASVNLIALLGALRACVRPPIESPLGTEAVLAAFGALYIGSFVVRTLLHERTVHAFEVAQTTAVMVIGFGGAMLVARVNGLSLIEVGLPAAIAGTALYAQTFWRVAARRGYGGDFHYYGLTAFGLTLAGATTLLPGSLLPFVSAAGAIVLAALASRLRQSPLLLQSGIAIVVAAIESGLLALVLATWMGRVDSWPSVRLPVLAVLAASAICYALPATARLGRDAFSDAARVLLATCLAATLGSLVLLLVGPAIAGRPPAPGVLATIRTVVLTASAVLLARLGRHPARAELVWLAYALLLTGGVKILAEDIGTSRASTLFIALGAYGLALIVTPRMTRSRLDGDPPRS